jgi:hypothetical protein
VDRDRLHRGACARPLWYLEFVVATTAAAGVLRGINGSVSEWLAELRCRWPDASPLGVYPAFAATERGMANRGADGAA